MMGESLTIVGVPGAELARVSWPGAVAVLVSRRITRGRRTLSLTLGYGRGVHSQISR